MKRFKNQKGFSLLAALLTLMAMIAMGGVVAYMVAANQQGRASHFQSMQSFYVMQAGIEYAIKKIFEGEDGIIGVPVTFGGGSFTSTRVGRTLTVTATVGDSSRSYRVDSPTEADCLRIYAWAPLPENGGTRVVRGLSFVKECLPSVTITQMIYSWAEDNSERLMTIRFMDGMPGENAYDNPAGIPSGTLADISDYVLLDSSTKDIDYVDFNASMFGMFGKTVTIQFNFADGSSKVVTQIIPPG